MAEYLSDEITAAEMEVVVCRRMSAAINQAVFTRSSSAMLVVAGRKISAVMSIASPSLAGFDGPG